MIFFDFLSFFGDNHELLHGQEVVDAVDVFHDDFLCSLLLGSISLIVFQLLCIRRLSIGVVLPSLFFCAPGITSLVIDFFPLLFI